MFSLFKNQNEISKEVINVFDYLTDIQKEDVSTRKASIDTTDAINSAINFALSRDGGLVFFPDGTYLVMKTIFASGHNIWLKGSGPGSTIIKFNNGNLDCIVSGGTPSAQIFRWSVTDFMFMYSGKTGGQTIKAHYTHNINIDNIVSNDCWSLFEFYVNNTINITNIYANGIRGDNSAFAISWKAPADGTGRSDIIFIKNFIANCYYSGANGIVWDGNAATLSAVDCYLLACNYAIIINNTARSKEFFPFFGNFYNVQIEGALINSVQINAGGYLKFVGCLIGNASGQEIVNDHDEYALTIGSDADASVTRGIKFIGCTMGGCRLGATLCDARDVDFLNCDFIGWWTTIPNTYAALTIWDNASDIKVIGCSSAMYGAPNPWKQGIFISPKAKRVIQSGNGWNLLFPNSITCEENVSNKVGKKLFNRK
jgi:hypothetical protein